MTKWKPVSVFACALILLSSFTSAWALYGRFSETNQRRAENADVWHAVICQIERAVVASPRGTTAKKLEAIKFYDKLLIEDVHTNGCGLLKRKL